MGKKTLEWRLGAGYTGSVEFATETRLSSPLFGIMIARTLSRLLASLVIAACFCQSGFAAVKWEMSWESSRETATMAPTQHEESRVPTIDLDSFSHSMESHPATGPTVTPSFHSEIRFFAVDVDSHPLHAGDILGEVIHVPWRSFKVPI